MREISRREISGVMVVKDGKAWGVEYEDGKGRAYGWVEIANGEIHDPRYCKHPLDVTYVGSHDEKKLAGATLLLARQIVITEVGS